MTEKKVLPESYERSRTVSLTCSGLAFLASITSQAKLDQLEPFGLKIGDLNKGFVVTSLMVMAAVSLASFLLAFFNDAADNYRSRRNATTKTITGLDMSQIHEFTGSLKGALATTERFYEEYDGIEKATMVTPQFRAAAIERIFTRVWTAAESIANAERQQYEEYAAMNQTSLDAHLREKLGLHAVSWDNLKAQAQESYVGLMEQLVHEIRPEIDLFWDPRTLSTAFRQVGEELAALDKRLAAASKDIGDYRKSLIMGHARYTAQVIVLGIGVPVTVFLLALAHALGAWFNVGLVALPDLFG